MLTVFFGVGIVDLIRTDKFETDSIMFYLSYLIQAIFSFWMFHIDIFL